MTERFEVNNFKMDLKHIKDELIYEAGTRPGEGPKVEVLFLSAAQRIQEAIEMLRQIKI